MCRNNSYTIRKRRIEEKTLWYPTYQTPHYGNVRETPLLDLDNSRCTKMEGGAFGAILLYMKCIGR